MHLSYFQVSVKMQTTKFTSAKFQKIFCQSAIANSKSGGCSVDLDESAHSEPLHQYLRGLQTQLFSSLVIEVFCQASFRFELIPGPRCSKHR